MKLKQLILFCLCAIFIVSCKPPESKPNEFVLNLNPSSKPLESTPPYARAKIVRLETSSSCLLSGIKRIRMTDSFIFVLDFNNLYVFTRHGKFVSQIGEQGEGPEEYLVLNSFYVDDNKKQVTIIDDFKNKLLNYDFTGKFISAVSVPLKSFQSCCNVQLTSDNKLLCFHMMDMHDTKAYSLFDLNKNKVMGQYFSYQPITVDNYMYAFSWFPMASSGNEIDMIMPICDTIFTYSASSASFYPKYIIETPQKMAPKHRIGRKTAAYDRELSKLSREGYFTGFTGIFETDTRVLLECNFHPMLGYFLFDKASKTGNYYISTWKKDTDTLPFSTPCYSYKNMFVSYMSAETLLSFKNIQDKEFLESIKGLQEDDNPCLILYEFE